MEFILCFQFQEALAILITRKSALFATNSRLSGQAALKPAGQLSRILSGFNVYTLCKV